MYTEKIEGTKQSRTHKQKVNLINAYKPLIILIFKNTIKKKEFSMKKKILALALTLTFAIPSFAAIQSAKITKSSTPVQEQEFTLGLVQRQVKVGASQDEVAIALGSPNIVTQDSEGKETWIYDKISSSITGRNKTESAMENSTYTRYFWHDILTLVTLGLINKDVKPELKDVSQVVTTQKTLTVVIKFDKSSKVESVTYHMSKF